MFLKTSKIFKGFTLMELLIYLGILSIVTMGVATLFNQINTSYLNTQGKTQLTQALRFSSQNITQAIQASSKIITATSSSLNLQMNEEAKNPTEFGLENYRIYKKEGAGIKTYLTPKNIRITNLNFYYLAKTVYVSITAQTLSSVPSLSISDSYDFAVPVVPVSNIKVTSVSPNFGSGSVSLTISGSNFQNGAVSKLARAGFNDILPTSNCNFVSSSSLQNCQFDVTGKAKGFWDVIVINPDGQMGILPQGFEILLPTILPTESPKPEPTPTILPTILPTESPKPKSTPTPIII